MKRYRYIIALCITSLLFGTAFYISNRINDARVASVTTMQENMAIDILSLETQFQLLQEMSCKDIKENSVLSKELSQLSGRLSYMEQQLGADNERVIRLKRQYSLLQIKDLLLMKQVARKCKLAPVFILYFYSNKDGACADCKKQGYALTALAEKYPQLRIYAFDYDLDLPALQTLVNINDVPAKLPALSVNDTVHTGYLTVEDIEKMLPALKNLPTQTKEK